MDKSVDWDYEDRGDGVIRFFVFIDNCDEEEKRDVLYDAIFEYMSNNGLFNHNIDFVNWGITFDGYDYTDIEFTPMR